MVIKVLNNIDRKLEYTLHQNEHELDAMFNRENFRCRLSTTEIDMDGNFEYFLSNIKQSVDILNNILKESFPNATSWELLTEFCDVDNNELCIVLK